MEGPANHGLVEHTLRLPPHHLAGGLTISFWLLCWTPRQWSALLMSVSCLPSVSAGGRDSNLQSLPHTAPRDPVAAPAHFPQPHA